MYLLALYHFRKRDILFPIMSCCKRTRCQFLAQNLIASVSVEMCRAMTFETFLTGKSCRITWASRRIVFSGSRLLVSRKYCFMMFFTSYLLASSTVLAIFITYFYFAIVFFNACLAGGAVEGNAASLRVYHF